MKQIELRTLIIIATFLFFSVRLFSQNILEKPDRALIDQRKLEQCEKEIEKIETLLLKCDTMYIDGEHRLYFDEQGRLRKFFRQMAIHDGSHEYITLSAYYNENGKLVYLEEKSGCNCDDREEYFYIYDGYIVDFGYYYDCGCCEEDDPDWIDPNIPEVGALYVDLRGFGSYYISTDNIFGYFNQIMGLENKQFSVLNLLPDTFPKMQASDIRYYENLQSLPPYFIRDSINNPKAYILQYFQEANTVIAIEQENRYVVFSIYPPSGYTEYEIAREDIDGIGNDELIFRLKYKEGDEYADYKSKEIHGYLRQESGVAVWCLDTYSCLLNMNLEWISKGWNYDNTGEKIMQYASCYGYKIDFDNKRFSIRKLKGCEGPENEILEQEYVYRLTESGFVSEK